MDYQLTFHAEQQRPKDYSHAQLMQGLLTSTLAGLVFGVGHYAGQVFLHSLHSRLLN